MRFRVEVDGEECSLDLRRAGADCSYALVGVYHSEGIASVVQSMSGVYSVLLGTQSFEVRVASLGSDLEVWAGTQRHIVSLADARDRSGKGKSAAATGPQEIRAQMPGKVIKLLVAKGESVSGGQGVIIVEAMKMQNEMKSPKDGVVSKVYASEGSTVVAGEALLLVE